MGIIGVVAALTLPVLTAEYQKKVTVTKLKQTYSELNRVIDRATADYGDPSGWSYYEKDNLEQWVKTYIAPYVNGAEVIACSNVGNSTCGNIVAMHALGYNVSDNNANAKSGGVIVKKTGGVVAWRFFRYGDVYEPVTRIYAYVNNKKAEHLSYAYSGKDIFLFILDKREQSPKIRPFENYDYNGYYGKPRFVYSVDREKLLGKKGNTWGGCFKNASGSGYYLPGDSCAAVIMKDGWEIKPDYPWRK